MYIRLKVISGLVNQQLKYVRHLDNELGAVDLTGAPHSSSSVIVGEIVHTYS